MCRRTCHSPRNRRFLYAGMPLRTGMLCISPHSSTTLIHWAFYSVGALVPCTGSATQGYKWEGMKYSGVFETECWWTQDNDGRERGVMHLIGTCVHTCISLRYIDIIHYKLTNRSCSSSWPHLMQRDADARSLLLETSIFIKTSTRIMK